MRRGLTLLATTATGIALFAVPGVAAALSPAVIINSVAPNPFSPAGNSPKTETVVAYSVFGTGESVGIQVTQGATVVRQVTAVGEAAGDYQWTWDGRDDLSQVVPDGTYTITLTATGSINGTAQHDVTVDSTRPVLTSITGGGTTFYPFPDRYHDTFKPAVTISERGTLALTIKNSTGHVVRTLQAIKSAGRHALTWNGRNTAGNLVPAGKYHWTYTETDAAGNHRTSASYIVHVSAKKLVKTTKVFTHNGGAFVGTDHQGCGAGVSRANSTYSSGVLLSVTCANKQGVALTAYSLRLPNAIKYGRMSFEMYGYSHRGYAVVVPLVYSTTANDFVLTRSAALTITSSSSAWRGLGSVPVSGHYVGQHVVHFIFGLGNRPGHPVDFDLKSLRVRVGCTVLR
jgi:flagellar hook assembly protein FlgD